MRLHGNAKLTPFQRALLCQRVREDGWTIEEAADAAARHDAGEPMTDRSSTWCATQHIDHIRTRPYRPRTNGKAERFIQTMLREWAYAATYRTSSHRARALPAWIDYYNHHRLHGALGHKTPASRIAD